MQSFIDHARAFRHQAVQRGDDLACLATGQSPQALFATCSDSRVVPALITGARPGDLFELRTAGGIIPHHSRTSGEAATIEYAVEVLGVTDIVVCGHSHCGAVGALVRGEDLAAVPAVDRWLRRAWPKRHLRQSPAGGPDIAEAVQSHVLVQLGRLRAYPCVAARLAQGRIRLHAWFYEIHTGSVLAHRPHDDAFLPL